MPRDRLLQINIVNYRSINYRSAREAASAHAAGAPSMDIAFGHASICTRRAEIDQFTTSRRQPKRLPPEAGFAYSTTMTLDLGVREMRRKALTTSACSIWNCASTAKKTFTARGWYVSHARSNVPNGLVRRPIGPPSSRPGRAQRRSEMACGTPRQRRWDSASIYSSSHSASSVFPPEVGVSSARGREPPPTPRLPVLQQLRRPRCACAQHGQCDVQLVSAQAWWRSSERALTTSCTCPCPCWAHAQRGRRNCCSTGRRWGLPTTR